MAEQLTPEEMDARDEKGRFAKGGKPKNGLDKNPQNRYSGGWSKERTPSYQYKRFWGMDTEELLLLAKQWGIVRWSAEEMEQGLHKKKYPHTMVEESALRYVIASNSADPNGLSVFKEMTNRVEGLPTQKLEAVVENKYSQMSEEELEKIARAYDTLEAQERREEQAEAGENELSEYGRDNQ